VPPRSSEFDYIVPHINRFRDLHQACKCGRMKHTADGSRRSGYSWMILTAFIACIGTAACAQTDNAMQHMVEEIADDFRRTAYLTGRKAMRDDVADAMRAVARDEFVGPEQAPVAYVNRPLPIGHGQTISQPYIVAIMTDLLDLRTDARVLEIGTGSGYQAAVLAEIAAEVYTIEIVEPLAKSAAERLRRHGYDNVQVRFGDGNFGWPEAAPFDGIIVTAGGRLPPALVEQLSPGGRLVSPIDPDVGAQELIVISKSATGELHQRALLPVRFVPITGDN
jgi:protein-L-isoaspartate(D-aspartate) O-methyltransferase